MQPSVEKPLYIDRKVRPTYPIGKKQCQKVSDNKYNEQIFKKLNNLFVYPLAVKRIEWDLKQVWKLKEILKNSIKEIKEFQKVYQNKLHKRNQSLQLNTKKNIQRAFLQIFYRNKLIHNEIKNICGSNHANTDLVNKNTLEKQNQSSQIFDCNNCLNIFKYLLQISEVAQQQNLIESPAHSTKNINENNGFTQPIRGKAKKLTKKFGMTSIPSEQSSNECKKTANFSNRDVKSHATILDSLLDIQIYKKVTKKKITSQQDRQLTASQIQEFDEQQQSKKNQSKLLQQNSKETQLSNAESKQKKKEERSAADKFYSVIKEAIRSKTKIAELKRMQQQQREEEQLNNNKQNNLQNIQSFQGQKIEQEQEIQSKLQQKNWKEMKASIQSKHKLRSTRRGNQKKIRFLDNSNQRKQKANQKSQIVSKLKSERKKASQEKISSRSNKLSNKGKIKKGISTGRHNIQNSSQRSYVLQRKGKLAQKSNKNTLIKHTKSHDQKSFGLNDKYNYKKINKRQAFLKKTKEKKIKLKSQQSDDEQRQKQILQNIKNQYQQSQFSSDFENSPQVLPRLTKYEEARMLFMLKFNKEMKEIRGRGKDKTTNNTMEPNQPQPIRQKRPSINLLVPPADIRGSKTLSIRSEMQKSVHHRMEDFCDNSIRHESMQNSYRRFRQVSGSKLAKPQDMPQQQFNLKFVKTNIRSYLNKYRSKPKATEMLNFFTYMEQTLQNQLKQKRKRQQLNQEMLIQENIEIRNFIQNLQPKVEQFESCNNLIDHMKYLNSQTRQRNYQERFIAKMNSRVIDLMYWNKDEQGTEEQMKLNQVSLRNIKQIM